MTTVHLRFATPVPTSPPGSPPRDRAPVLERLIARADRDGRDDPHEGGGDALPAATWRDRAYRALAVGSRRAPPVGPTALVAAQGATRGAWACIASPLNLVAGMTDVTLGENGVLVIDRAEALALADDFNRVFPGAGARLWVGRTAELILEFDRSIEVRTHDPAQLPGADLYAFQAAGPDAGELRRLMSEIEMWLFDHALNQDRLAASRPAITALWLWGGGPVLSALPEVQGWTAGPDPLFAAFDSRPESPLQRFPQQGGAGVMTALDGPGSPTWRTVESEWLAPAAAALGAGRIQRLDLSSGTRSFSLRSASRWRLWRRVRPWWESLEERE